MKKKSIGIILLVLLIAVLLVFAFPKRTPDVTVYKDINAALAMRTSRTKEQIYESFPLDDGDVIIYYDSAMDAYSMEQFVYVEEGCYTCEQTAWLKAAGGFTFHAESGEFDIKAEPMENGTMNFTLIEK